jgi:hypothetical protein
MKNGFCGNIRSVIIPETVLPYSEIVLYHQRLCGR